MDKNDLISVIVPVYNSAKYIDDCVESVLRQTYACFELFLVDDGSQDDSRGLCERFCQRDSRIHLICQEHRGVSAARNAGMRRGRGKYLFFLDSDDVIHPQLLEALYKQQKKMQTAIAAVKYCSVGEAPFQKAVNWELTDPGEWKCRYLGNEETMRQFCNGDREIRLYAAGGKLIYRGVARGLKFSEKVTHGEDTLFFYRLFARGADVSVLSQNWYGYRKREGAAAGQYSVASCRSRYRIETHIRSQEVKNKRMSNAAGLEIAIVDAIMQWYIVGHKTHDVRLKQYTKKLAAMERAYDLFKKLDRLRKIKFFLMFHCYPLYWAIYLLLILCNFGFVK